MEIEKTIVISTFKTDLAIVSLMFYFTPFFYQNFPGKESVCGKKYLLEMTWLYKYKSLWNPGCCFLSETSK